MNRLILIFSFLCAGLLGYSCSTAPEFERDNENDLGSDRFLPDPPSNANYSIDNQNAVLLQWVDNSSYETGYRIYKALGDTSFSLVVELPPNSTSYTDNTGDFAFPTSFRIVSITDSIESIAQEIEIYFGEILDFSASKIDQGIELTWSDNVSLHDGYLVTRSPDTNDDHLFVESVSRGIKSIQIEVPQDGFVHDFFITPFKVFQSDTTLEISKSTTINATGPTKIAQSLIGVDSLLVTWEDNSEFENGFELTIQINQNKEAYTVSENNNSFYIQNAFEQGDEISSSVVGFVNQTLSPVSKSDILDLANIPPPAIDSVFTTSNSELQLLIRERFPVKRNIEIFRSTNDNELIPIGVLAPGDSIFVDSNLDKKDIYTYVLKTTLSNDSSPYSVYYKLGFSFVDKIYHSENWLYSFQYSPSTNQLVYCAGISENQADYLYFFNLENFSSTRISTPTQKHVEYIKMNKTGDKFALYDRIGNEDKIYLYNTNSKSLVKTLSIENLDYARDLIFSPDDENIFLSTQIHNLINGGIDHKILKLELQNGAVQTIEENLLGKFYTNYNSNSLFLFFKRRNTNASLLKYIFQDETIQYDRSYTFNSNLISSSQQVISSPFSMDTLLFSSRYHEHRNGIIRYDLGLDQIIDSTAITINGNPSSVTGLYHSPNYSLGQVYDGVYIIEHTSEGYEVIDYYKYDLAYQFKDDFIYLNDKNLLIDVRSNYGSTQYLESNFRIFEVKKKWRQVYVQE